ncbi:MAG: 50S ribosomal protein L10 [Armatimonadetes bacterium]|nr:50S ribosomal protein L10 [Armatimonadota bacterium]
MTTKTIPEKKQKAVGDLQDLFQKARVGIVTDYRGPSKNPGLTVSDLQTLRGKLREQQAEYRVVKNTLARIALKDTALEPLSSVLSEATAIAFGYDDPVGPAKVLLDFAKERKTPLAPEGLPFIKGGFLDGRVFDGPRMRELARLPAPPVIKALLLGTLISPARGALTVLKGPMTKFLYALQALKKLKEEE